MDSKQLQTLKTLGYAILEVPNLKKSPHMDYITPDGRILYGLPSDAYHMRRYLSRGLKPIDSKPQLVCEVCGKEFKHKIALSGHSRTHKNSKKEVKDEFP